MRWIVVALALVGLLGLCATGFGLAAGLTSDVTAGVEGRPFIYWMIAGASLGTGMIFLPALLSWFVALELPAWHSDVMRRGERVGRLERIRRGKTILTAAHAVEPRRRLGLAGRTFGYGLFYVVLSIPVQLMLGVAAMRPGLLRLEEAAPLIVALLVPLLWTATLVARSRRNPSRDA